MLTLQPAPCPIETVVEQITDTLFPPNWDREGREKFRQKLLEFAALIQRSGAAA